MEVDEDHMQACKFPRIRSGGNKIGPNGDDEDEGEAKRVASGNDIGRFCGWPSSRIVRVSRASGGKDRHSKVWTSKGLRDRRVRLSVTTAIQFYDLQDRLGYDQPSKAVDWLLKAAESSISELPSLNALSFPNTPKQLSDEKRSSGGTTEHGFDSNDLELDMGPNYHHQNQNASLSKSACSSTSETSKGSGGLSISQSEFRIKPRERQRRRAVEKEKEKESKALISGHHPNVTPISQSFSFTELLTSGANNNSCSRNSAAPHLHKSSSTQWPNAPMNYFSTGLNQTSSDLSGQIQLGNSLPQSMMVSPIIGTSGDQHQHHELQHFSFVQDNVVPVASDYSQNLSISSGLAGYNRGTLQSNLTPSLLPQLHHHRFSPIDGSNSSPFFTSTPAVSIGTTTENQHQHHQFPAGFDARLHLYYGDADRHSDHQFPYTSQEKKANK